MPVEKPSTDWLELPETQCLRVRGPNTKGAWLIRLPIWPWMYKRAEAERRSLLASLVRRFPYQGLWLPNENNSEYRWVFHSLTHPLQSIEPQELGEWALFLFNKDPRSQLPEISVLRTDADVLRKILRTLSAQFAVVSCTDDNEWILVSQ
jgi:hypothetical protein